MRWRHFASSHCFPAWRRRAWARAPCRASRPSSPSARRASRPRSSCRNTNTDDNAADINTVCNAGDPAPCPVGARGIVLTPSCAAQGPDAACTRFDPGVFAVSPTAAGAPGTACANTVFDVTVADAAERHRPLHAARRPRDAPGSGAACRIVFTFSVARRPRSTRTRASRASRPSRWRRTPSTTGALPAFARGTSVGVTVLRATPRDRDRRLRQGRGRRAAHRHRDGDRARQPGAGRDRRLPPLRTGRRELLAPARLRVARPAGRRRRHGGLRAVHREEARRLPLARVLQRRREQRARRRRLQRPGREHDRDARAAGRHRRRPARGDRADEHGQQRAVREDGVQAADPRSSAGLREVKVKLDGKTIRASEKPASRSA